MREFTLCKQAIEECLNQKRFAIAYLYNEEKTMNIHIHDCYEIYYSISGGKQFLIDDQYYDILPGDLFVINNFESHYLTQIDDTSHKRVVISIYPEYLQNLSTPQTDLSACFLERNYEKNKNHRIRLNHENQQRFTYLTHKITSASGFGSDVTETACFLELMVMINGLHQQSCEKESEICNYQYNENVGKIINYINQNITQRMTIAIISEHFYLSEAYICRLFKSETGTTINKYLTARRISIAKSMLAAGSTVSDACEQSGFYDYTNFVQVFTRLVGMTPKRYGKCSVN